MMIPLNALEVLDREFLEVRARLLQMAAVLDRMDRAAGGAAADPRLEKIRQALAILQGESGQRAERIQLLFSRTYEPDWRTRFGLDSKSDAHGASATSPAAG
jgi:hypothetical protein